MSDAEVAKAVDDVIVTKRDPEFNDNAEVVDGNCRVDIFPGIIVAEIDDDDLAIFGDRKKKKKKAKKTEERVGERFLRDAFVCHSQKTSTKVSSMAQDFFSRRLQFIPTKQYVS